ncbi:MAG: hypothetical protein CL912_30405 [Deltaproteobacteria bacterium]|nr:hypothetical protein [Deltaproteobacteria bacterium]
MASQTCLSTEPGGGPIGGPITAALWTKTTNLNSFFQEVSNCWSDRTESEKINDHGFLSTMRFPTASDGIRLRWQLLDDTITSCLGSNGDIYSGPF